MPARTVVLVAAGAVTLASCGATDAPSRGDESTPATRAPAAETVEVDQVPSSPRAVTHSAIDAWRTRIRPTAFPEPLIDLDEIRSGGPPPDGIPPIDTPRFLRPTDVDFLADREPVLALEIDGDHRAYPVQILTWHEIVNDTVAGIPVSVTYCPLCNSAIAFDRRLGDRVLDFGTSGLLWNSALVMYDRQTESLWSHFTGQAVFGELTGEASWCPQNPSGRVVRGDDVVAYAHATLGGSGPVGGQPGRRLVRAAQGLPGTLRQLRPTGARAPRPRRGRAQSPQQPDASSPTSAPSRSVILGTDAPAAPVWAVTTAAETRDAS